MGERVIPHGLREAVLGLIPHGQELGRKRSKAKHWDGMGLECHPAQSTGTEWDLNVIPPKRPKQSKKQAQSWVMTAREQKQSKRHAIRTGT
mmetsp:Transcript_57490/g.68657  ORF Transcript_57490/g.68657 Transcript_57490/m.68657 type:complete len:91 (-) Transcript_57490:11-283(-)